MSENFDRSYDEQKQIIEAQQANSENPEVKSEAENPEKKKKEEILQLLNAFSDAEKVITILEKHLSLQEMEDFCKQIQLLSQHPAQQEEFWEKARELKTDTARMKDEEKQAQREKERSLLQSAFLKVFGEKDVDLQLIGQLANQWKAVQIENERKGFDQARINTKIQHFQEHFKEQNFSEKELADLMKSVGKLTFEVFLDDLQKGKYEKLNAAQGLDLKARYQIWLQEAIQEVSQLDYKTFINALESAQNNNYQDKKRAEEQILRIEQEKSLSAEEKIAKKQAVHQEWQQQAIAENKMLNRQELVFSGLVGHKGFYWNNGSELIYKLQVIGKSYYNTKNISLDGKWGPQTSTVAQQLLQDFENDPNFPEEAKTTLEKLLKTRKYYENQELKKKLQENQLSNQFDLAPVIEKSSQKKEKKEADLSSESLSDTDAKKMKAKEAEIFKEEKKQSDLFNDFSLQEIEQTIPQDEYLTALKGFLQGIQKKNPNKAELQSLNLDQLSQVIFEGNASDPLHKKIAQARENSLQRRNLLNEQQDWIKKHLNNTSGQVALQAAESFFGKFGIRRQIEDWELIKKKGYFTFQDGNGKEFYYRPSSGNFSTQVFHTHDRARKQIDISGNNYRILLSIPRYEDFINKAAQDNYLLSGERPKSRQALENRLQEKLSGQITHSAGTIEQAGIEHIVKEEQAKTKIMQKMGKMLNLEDNDKILKEEQSPVLYQLFQPFVNSCAVDTLPKLQRLEQFVEKLEEMKERSQEINRKLTPETDLQAYADQLQPKNPEELLKLVLQPKDLLDLKLKGKGENRNQKSGLEQLIAWLSSPQTGKDQTYDKIDDEKLNFLLNPEEREKSNNQQYRESFAQMRSEIVGKYLKEAGDKESEEMSGIANKKLAENTA